MIACRRELTAYIFSLSAIAYRYDQSGTGVTHPRGSSSLILGQADQDLAIKTKQDSKPLKHAYTLLYTLADGSSQFLRRGDSVKAICPARITASRALRSTFVMFASRNFILASRFR